MDEVKITPDRVDDLADQLSSLQQKMNEKMGEANTSVISMRNCWKDAVKKDYDNDFKKLKQEFEEFSEQIPSIARHYHDHAAKMREIGTNL